MAQIDDNLIKELVNSCEYIFTPSYLMENFAIFFTNDLPSSVSSGSVFMFADDTTVYCISETAEKSIVQLNSALRELNVWCLINRLTPHPSKSEAMLISGKTSLQGCETYL